MANSTSILAGINSGILNRQQSTQAAIAEAKTWAAGLKESGTQISKTVFSGAGTDEVLAVDAYGIRDTLAKNSLYQAARGAANEVGEQIRKSSGLVNDAVGFARAAEKKVVSEAQMAARLVGSLGTSGVAALKNLTGEAQDKFYSVMNDTIGSAGLGMVKTVIGDQSYSSNTGCLDHLGGISDLFGAFTGNSALARLIDIQAEVALFAGILQDAIGCGVSAFSTIKEISSDKTVWQRAFAISANKAIHSARLDDLATIVAEVGGSRVLGENPNAVQQVLAQYKLPYDLSPDRYKDEYTKLTSVLSSIDKTWDSSRRGTSSVLNYTLLGSASEDAKTLLNQDARYRTALQTASYFNTGNIASLTQAQYSLAPVA